MRKHYMWRRALYGEVICGEGIHMGKFYTGKEFS